MRWVTAFSMVLAWIGVLVLMFFWLYRFGLPGMSFETRTVPVCLWRMNWNQLSWYMSADVLLQQYYPDTRVIQYDDRHHDDKESSPYIQYSEKSKSSMRIMDLCPFV